MLTKLDEIVCEARRIFEETFNESATVCAYSAGRVNLIGEHVDYNDGFVMPMAIPLYTVIVGKKCDESSKNFEICSTSYENNQDRRFEFEFPFEMNGRPKWAAYVLGVLSLYQGKFDPFKALVHSTVPLGGGLSSSASLETATFRFVDEIAHEKSGLTCREMALLCQKAEHEYARVPCGIMDQFSCAMSKRNCAILLNCRTLCCEYLPIDDPNVVVLVTNSNVKHELNNSEYANRRKACHDAAAIVGRQSLRDVTVELLEENRNRLDDTAYKRARHVITEIGRTEEAARALKDADYARFGRLMVESHRSLRNDFQVSCAELDALVELALSCPGVFGSRMTGGGFGGCTVTLVDKGSVQNVCDLITEKYTGRATFYVCSAVDGSGVVALIAAND